MSSASVRIAIADDHGMFRSGLKSLLMSIGDYEVYEFTNGLDLIHSLKRSVPLPDICIVDLQMHPLNGYETALLLKKNWPQIKTVALSMYENELVISKLLQAGISCYLCKNNTAEVLSLAIDQIMKMGYYHTETVTRVLMGRMKSMYPFPKITEKELQYLCLCCSDLTNKEIALKMNVQTRTVDNYRDSLFSKLGKHTRGGLAIFATTTGIINLSVDYLLSNNLYK